MSLIALVHSRQPLRPTGDSSWVSATCHAVKALALTPDAHFLCSLGSAAHELTLTALCRAGADIEVMLHQEQARPYGESESEIEEYVSHQYNLSAARLRLNVIKTDVLKTETALSGSHARDIAILEKADIIYPISIRPGGFMDKNIMAPGGTSKKVDREYLVPYVSQPTAIARDYRLRSLNRETEKRLQDHLIHWTRSSSAPWPGEICADYYSDIMGSGKDYARSARKTLMRMLREKLIRGSARHSPDNEKFSAFTSAGAVRSINMMRYRARYREMTCEPFGVAIPRSASEKVGIRKVLYLSADQVRKLPASQRRFVHAEGASGRWISEHEWRTPGDVDLRGLESEITVIVESESDREEFERNTGFKTLALFAG